MAIESEVYTIKQGDSIDVTVWGYPEFNTKGTIRQSGTIIVPLIGEMKVGGLTKEEFQEELKQKLSEYVQGEPKMVISIVSSLNQRITVIGAVSRQENYPVITEVSLIEVISAAGGATPESDLHRVKIIRNGSNEDPTEVDVAAALESGRVDMLPKVRPGDTVFIPKTENALREFSDFLRDAVLLFGFFRVFY
jgi:polysaccharide export outer membrane protein